jgi:hypothetical protein
MGSLDSPRTMAIAVVLAVCSLLLSVSLLRFSGVAPSIGFGEVFIAEANTFETPDGVASTNSTGIPNTASTYPFQTILTLQARLEQQPPHPHAFVTLIASVDYDIGAQILVCRLRHYSPSVPIYVLVDRSVELRSHAYYEKMKAEIVVVSNPVRNISSLTGEVRSNTYTKLNVWRMESIAETIVYLDADVLPVRNPHGLFKMLPSDKNFGVSGSNKYFNSGVFVFRPSMETFRQLQRRIETNDYQKNKDPTEQDVLISHFAQSNNTIHIPDDYNYRPLHHQAGLSDNARIVHWIGNPKPWTEILGKKTSIQGQEVTKNNKKSTMPQWSRELYQCEMERYFAVCHDPEEAARDSNSQSCIKEVNETQAR